MDDSFPITRKQAKSILDASFPEYTGRKIKIEFRLVITFYDTNWSGGTCNKYAVLANNGQGIEDKHVHVSAPWANPAEGYRLDMRRDIVVVCRSYFCGKDCGITIYAHPSYAPRLLHQGEQI